MEVYIVSEQSESLNCLNRLLYEAPGCASAIILKIFFCKVVEKVALGDKLSSKYYVFSMSVLFQKIRHNNSFIHHRSSVNLPIKGVVQQILKNIDSSQRD